MNHQQIGFFSPSLSLPLSFISDKINISQIVMLSVSRLAGRLFSHSVSLFCQPQMLLGNFIVPFVYEPSQIELSQNKNKNSNQTKWYI